MQSLPVLSLISLITLCLTSLLGLVQAARVSNTILHYEPCSSLVHILHVGRCEQQAQVEHHYQRQTVQNDKDIGPLIPLWTENDIDQCTNDQGLVIYFSTLGPGYRVEARPRHEKFMILGKMQVFEPTAERVKCQMSNVKFVTDRFGGVSFGIG